MRKQTGLLAICILLAAGSAAALESLDIAQAPAEAGPARQRAPGVPLAPSPGTVGEREQAIGEPSTVAPRRTSQKAGAPSQVDRPLPMPRGVPSIMAP